MSRIRVMLVEQDYYSRRALYSLLVSQHQIAVVDTPTNLEEAAWLLESNPKPLWPNVILFDAASTKETPYKAEGLQGFLAKVKSLGNGCRVVCCVDEPSLDFIQSVVKLGVDAILKRDEVGSRIAEAVQRVHEGAFVYTPAVSELAFGRLKGIEHRHCYLLRLPASVPLEHNLCRVARWYCQDGMTAAEIGRLLTLSESGIRRQIRQIYRILGVNSRREAADALQEME